MNKPYNAFYLIFPFHFKLFPAVTVEVSQEQYLCTDKVHTWTGTTYLWKNLIMNDKFAANSTNLQNTCISFLHRFHYYKNIKKNNNKKKCFVTGC